MIFYLLLILAVGLLSLRPVQAQATKLSVLPAEGELILNASNSITLLVEVTDVVDLMAYDVSFTYDPAVLTLTKWEHGGFLSSLFSFKVVNTPGFLRLAFGQVAVPAVSGSGTLLKLTFSGATCGTSPVTISNAVFSKPTGEKIYPVPEHGSLTALFDTNLVIPSALTGSIGLQGVSARGGIPVNLEQGVYFGDGPYSAASLDQPGDNLSFASITADVYRLTTQQARFLNIDSSLNKTITVTAAAATLPPLILAAGNAVWTDNIINSADASLVGTWFGKTSADLQPGEVLDADVNFDGVVNIRDLALVAGIFGTTSAQAYADWMP